MSITRYGFHHALFDATVTAVHQLVAMAKHGGSFVDMREVVDNILMQFAVIALQCKDVVGASGRNVMSNLFLTAHGIQRYQATGQLSVGAKVRELQWFRWICHPP